MKAIKIKKLYDGTKNKPIANAIIIFDKTGIKKVLNNNNEKELKEYKCEFIDFSNKYMMPGLIDAHVHLLLPGDGSYGEQILANHTLGEIQLIAAKNAYHALKKGITTLRDCGSLPEITFALRNAIEKEIINGPDLILCGSPLTTTGGHLYYFQGEVDGEEDIRKFIKIQFKNGANFTKIMVDTGGTLGIIKGVLNFSLEELKAAVSETHRLLSKATAHCTSLEGIKQAMEANIDGIEHCWPVDFNGNMVYDRALNELIAKKEVIVCPTIQVRNNTIKYLLNKNKLSDSEKKELEENKRLESERIKVMSMQVQDGISCVAGSDAGWRHTKFGDLYIGLGLMAEAGMKNIDVINSATGLSATYLGLGHKLGFLKPGFQADLLILDDDPGENILNTGKVHTVFKKGRIVSNFYIFR